MADVIVTMNIMPKSPDVDLEAIKLKATEIVAKHEGEVGKSEYEPLAFGLKALKLYFVRDESKGSVDEIEKEIKGLDGVASAEVSDVRRAIG